MLIYQRLAQPVHNRTWNGDLKMRRVLVFGLGAGGKNVISYLQEELSTVEIVSLIDQHTTIYDTLLPKELLSKVVRALQSHIGKAEVIVLANYILTPILADLQRLFPEQLFVSVDFSGYQMARNYSGQNQVIILASPALQTTLWFDDLTRQFDGQGALVPNCAGWEQLIDDRGISIDILHADLQELGVPIIQKPTRHRRKSRKTTLPLVEQLSLERAQSGTAAQNVLEIRKNLEENLRAITFLNPWATRPNLASHKKTAKHITDSAPLDKPAYQNSHRRQISVRATPPIRSPTKENSQAALVILLSTHFWSIRPELEQIFGRRAKIIDFRKKLLHDVCFALGLRGVHGDRPE